MGIYNPLLGFTNDQVSKLKTYATANNVAFLNLEQKEKAEFAVSIGVGKSQLQDEAKGYRFIVNAVNNPVPSLEDGLPDHVQQDGGILA